MKSLTLFLRYLLTDVGRWCGISTTLDCKTIERRVEHEGQSFLGITLPGFGKDFETSLDQGQVTRHLFVGFQRKGELPRFLGGFLELVFDRNSGRLRDEPDVTAIWAIRQICFALAKIELPVSEKRREAAIAGYVATEREVREADAQMSEELLSDFQRIGSLLWARVLQPVDEDIYYERLVPRHGSGSTADRLKGNLKWMQQVWPERLEREFPAGNYLFSHPIHLSGASVTWTEPGAEIPVKVITVPKTLKTPRIIAMEPTCMQYMQQGILRSLVQAIRADDTARRLIGFSSQVPNQELAREGSLKGDLATLDLSEASDRVSNQHVRALLSRHPHLAGGVDACRSRKADVPGYGVKRLAKFASMGSALAFPFEAMVFTTIIFMAIEQDLSRRITRTDIQSYLDRVRVYGDDIIVPVAHVPSVVRLLTSFGMKVNRSKSFWTGKFRESCGKEFYDGEDVSIVRLRREIPTHRQQVERLESVVETRNHLYKAGLWATAGHLDDVLGRVLGHFPNVTDESPVLGRVSFLGHDVHGIDSDLQIPLVKGFVARAPLPSSPLDGVSALLKCLIALESKDSDADPLPGIEDHLLLAGRPKSSTLKLRYARP